MEQLTINGKKYPFYKTMRGMVDFNRSGFTHAQLLASDIEAILMSAYCTVRGACKREGVKFEMDFEQFVDEVDADFLEQLNKLMGEGGVPDEEATEKKP